MVTKIAVGVLALVFTLGFILLTGTCIRAQHDSCVAYGTPEAIYSVGRGDGQVRYCVEHAS